MGNILIINNPTLNTWGFAKLATMIGVQFKSNLTIYGKIPALQVPVLASGIEDDTCVDASSLEDKLEQLSQDDGNKQPPVLAEGSIDIGNIIDALVVQNVQLIIMSKEDEMLKDFSPAQKVKFINSLNCPVLMLPEAHCEYPNKIAYLTDLRYCTVEALRYMKLFGGSIYVAHMTLPGMTDIEERYAQEMLAGLASRSCYNKIFLRNIRGKANDTALQMITDQVGINCIAIESKKQLPLENFLPGLCDGTRNYDHVALLVLPYLNWRR